MVINIWANSRPEGKLPGSSPDGRDWSSHNQPGDLSFARCLSRPAPPCVLLLFFFLKTWFHSFAVRICKLVNRGMKYDSPHLGSSPGQGAYKSVRSDQCVIFFFFFQELSEICLLTSKHMFFRFIVKSKCDSTPNKRDGISNWHIWSNCCRLALKTPHWCQK